jgi:uncharacterized DUF497 family protein
MITWDEAKRRTNLAKHGMDLADAERFDFDGAMIEEDRDAKGEQRFRAVGWIGNRLCYLIYTERGEEMRVISLRPVTRKERRDYEQRL